MEAMTMMKVAAALFGVAALGGLLQAGMRFSGMPHPPAWLSMLHGLLAAAGLTLLLYAAWAVGVPGMAKWAIALFLIAVAGGTLMNLGFHWKNRALPIPLMLGHAALAMGGFGLLLAAIYP